MSQHPLLRWLIRLLVISVMLPILAVVVLSLWIAFELWSQSHLGPDVEASYGFELGTPYVEVDGEHWEVLEVSSVTPGGVFDAAGVQPGDIVVSHGLGSLYRDLYWSGSVTIEIVPPGPGDPPDQRPRRQVVIDSP